MFIVDYLKEVYGAVKSLLVGMNRTGYYFTHHKEIITQQYPDNREELNLPERFRGEVVMAHDENNEHKYPLVTSNPVIQDAMMTSRSTNTTTRSN
jgi:NADH-quinone oxidoreductase subunit I